MKLRHIRTNAPRRAVSSARFRLLALAATIALIALAGFAAFGVGDAKTVEAQSPGDTVSVSNLDQSAQFTATVGTANNKLYQVATSFTTGSVANGYTLQSVTVGFYQKIGSSSPRDIVVAVHTDSGGNPASSATYTLVGDNPDTAGNYTYTCPTNTVCQLLPGTTYFLVLSAPGSTSSNYYYIPRLTNSNNETTMPSNTGWRIADTAKFKTDNAAWKNDSGGYTGWLKVTATVNTPKTLSFGSNTIPSQTYPKDTAITTLTLPAATPSTGSPSIAYGLDCGTPDIPAGLTYTASNRQLSGTPTTLGSASCTYTASATGYPSATQTFNIVVYDASQATPARPDAPAKPTLTAGVGSITVNWNEPANNLATITDYDVQYCWWTWEDVDYCKNVANWQNWHHSGTATTATITGLYGGHTHLVKVRAVNSKGASEWSVTNSIKPNIGSLGAPKNIKVTAMEHENGDWLKVDWDFPAWSGARVEEWQVRYRYCKTCDANNPDWSIWEHQNDDGGGFSDDSIYNIVAGVKYEVQVRGRAYGWGAWSDPATADTRSKAQGAQGQQPPPTATPAPTPVPPGNSIANCYSWYKGGVLVDHSHPGTGCIVDWYWRSGHSHQLADGSEKAHSH